MLHLQAYVRFKDLYMCIDVSFAVHAHCCAFVRMLFISCRLYAITATLSSRTAAVFWTLSEQLRNWLVSWTLDVKYAIFKNWASIYWCLATACLYTSYCYLMWFSGNVLHDSRFFHRHFILVSGASIYRLLVPTYLRGHRFGSSKQQAKLQLCIDNAYG